MMRKPNFFIIGAPRCATSALAQYLREHPKIFLSDPKELDHFNTDHSFSHSYGGSQGYLKKFFSRAAPEHEAVGEASVSYLYSKEAVPNILKFQPEAKFIVLLRDPMEAVPSLYALKVTGGDENAQSLKEAWHLQEARSRGQHIPRYCLEPELLQYGKVYRYAEQLERIFKLVPKERVLVLLFEDLKSNPKKLYEEVLGFLSVPTDNRQRFPVVNERKRRRLKPLYYLFRRFKHAGLIAKFLNRAGISSSFLLVQTGALKNIPLDVKREMAGYFQDDVAKLEGIIKRDLSHWLATQES